MRRQGKEKNKMKNVIAESNTICKLNPGDMWLY